MPSTDDETPKPLPLSYAEGNFPPLYRRRRLRHYVAMTFGVPFVLFGSLFALGAAETLYAWLTVVGTGRRDEAREDCLRLAACALIAIVSGSIFLVTGYRGEPPGQR